MVLESLAGDVSGRVQGTGPARKVYDVVELHRAGLMAQNRTVPDSNSWYVCLYT